MVTRRIGTDQAIKGYENNKEEAKSPVFTEPGEATHEILVVEDLQIIIEKVKEKVSNKNEPEEILENTKDVFYD